MPFQKGQSGNPNGRPKGAAGFSATIREETRGGEELLEFALKVMRGQIEVPQVAAGGVVVDFGPSIKERLDAMKWLAERGFGKPFVEPEDPAREEWAKRDYSETPTEELLKRVKQ